MNEQQGSACTGLPESLLAVPFQHRLLCYASFLVFEQGQSQMYRREVLVMVLDGESIRRVESLDSLLRHLLLHDCVLNVLR